MIYILDKVYSQTSLRYFFPILKPFVAFLEKRFTKAASKTLVISSVHAKYIEDRYGVKPEILHLPVIPPKKLPTKRGNAILSFGRWQKEKNPEVLLKLIREIKGAKLIVAGTWLRKEDFRNFKLKITNLGLEERVTLIPRYKEEDIAKICKMGRIWVHPHFEAFSLSALEAAVHGLPIIIPRRSGVTELFKEGIHGFFPKKINVKTLKKAVLPFLKDERLAFQMGLEAAEVARKNSPQKHAAKLVTIIKTCLEETNKPELIAIETGHIIGSSIAGGDRLLEEMVKRINLKFELTVILPNVAKKHWQKNTDVKLKILGPNLFEKKTTPLGVFMNYLIRTLQTSMILATNSASMIYSSTGIFPDTSPAFFTKLLWPKKKWVARIHHLSPPPGQRPGRWWVNLGAYTLQLSSLFCIKMADVILVLNKSLKDELAKKGFPKEKIKILGGGVDYQKISKFKPARVKGYEGIFLGRIHPSKGIYDLVPIWKDVVRQIPVASLAVIGTGSPEFIDSLKSNIHKEHFSKNIVLTGYLPESKVFSILKKSKVFLFTDREAGFGLAVAEAMAAGLPVVGWDIGILGNVFKNGFLTSRLDDYQTFATHIIDLITNEEKRLRLSKMAQKQASKMDWNKTSEKFEKILKSLI